MGRSSEHVTVEVWGRRIRLAYAVRGWKAGARSLGKPWPVIRRLLLTRGSGPVPLMLDGQDVTLEIPICWGLTTIGSGRLWFKCPGCHGSRAIVYGCTVDPGAGWTVRCRRCLGLRYMSTQSRGTYIAQLARRQRNKERLRILLDDLRRSRPGSKRYGRLWASYERWSADDCQNMTVLGKAMQEETERMQRLLDTLGGKATPVANDGSE